MRKYTIILKAMAWLWLFAGTLAQGQTITAWGNNDHGQIDVPANLTGITSVSAGFICNLALKNDGTIVGFGSNSYGQQNIPAGLTGVVSVLLGFYHSVALKNDGTVVAWGLNDFGQTNIPAGLTGVTAISAGRQHTVALKSDGTVVAWGYNSQGQCDVPAGLSGVIAVAAGSFHSLALKNDGTVVAWGSNAVGERNTAGLTGITAISAGSYSTYALKNDSTVVALGRNDQGQTSVPVGLTGVIAIAAGANHAIALKNNGTVVAWGNNAQTAIPAGLTDVTAISAGTLHTLALVAPACTTPAVPSISASGATSFCSGGSVTLTSSAISGNLWSNGATTQSINVSSTGSYSVRAVSGACTSAVSEATAVTVGTTPATPTISASGATEFLEGGSVILTSSATNGNVWSNGATSQSITVSAAGSYTVRAISGACTSAVSAATAVTVVSAEAPTAGLMAFYPFDGNANDGSGNSQNGIVNGATLTTDRFGNAGRAYSFDGQDDFIQLPSCNYIGSTVTFNGWINVRSHNFFSRLFDFGNGFESDNAYLTLSYINEGRPATALFNGSTSGNFIVQSSVLALNQWVMLTMVVNGTNVKIYQNGVLTTNATSTVALRNVTRTLNYIGKSNWNDAYTNGNIDDFRVYNRVLSPLEISVLYNLPDAGCTTPATPTISVSGSTALSLGGSVVLSSSVADAYLWSNGATTRNITVSNAGSYSVQAISGECTSAVSAATVVTGGTSTSVTACAAPPVTIDFSRLGSTVCYLSWTANGNATSYRVFWKKTDANAYWSSPIYDASKLAFKIENMSPNTDYQMYLAVLCTSSGTWSNSAIVPFRTKNELCVPPTIAPSVIGKNVVRLSGFTYSGIAYYSVQWRVSGTNSWLGTNVSTATHDAKNLLAGTTYDFRVRAVCANANSDMTSYVNSSFTTAAAVACAAPVPTSSAQTLNTISVNWNAVEASSYVVRWQVQGASNWFAPVTVTGTSHTITGLSAGVTYNVQVQAKCTPLGEMTDYSASLSVATSSSSTCSTPAIDSLVGSATRSVSVFWTAASNISQYEISRRPLGGTWNAPIVVAGTANRANMSSTWFAPTFGNSFEVRMRAKCADNNTFVAYQYKTITLAGAARVGIAEAINLSVYPNPSTGIVNISAENFNEVAMYYVYNAMGQMVSSGEMNSETATLDLSSQASGMYLLKVVSNGAVQTKQITINR